MAAVPAVLAIAALQGEEVTQGQCVEMPVVAVGALLEVDGGHMEEFVDDPLGKRLKDGLLPFGEGRKPAQGLL